MKTAKKLFASLLAVVMALALAVPAFAVGDGNEGGGETTIKGSITITNPIDGVTYTAYKIFDVTYNTDKAAYAYTISGQSQWFNVVYDSTSGSKVDGLTITESTTKDIYVVTAGEGFSAANFAKTLGATVAADTDGTYTVAATLGPKQTTDTTLTASNLDFGYYFVYNDSTNTSALFSLDTTNPDATIRDKNQLPTIEKDAVDDKGGPIESPTASVGDTVNFQVTIITEAGSNSVGEGKGAKNYVLHDTMSDGLTFDGADSVSVTLNGETVSNDNNKNFTVQTPGKETEENEQCTFEVLFTEAFLADLLAGDKLVISYSATINANAVTVDEVKNTATLNYGEDKNVSTEDDPTEIKTYSFDLIKTGPALADATSGDYQVVEGETTTYYNKLDGAKFKLYAQTGGNEIVLVQETDAENNTYYRPATADEKKQDGFSAAVIEAGQATIKGLAAGTYYLEETEAPGGYNSLTERVKVEIKDTNLSITTVSETDATLRGGIQVINETGAELPSTGGIGTTIFYVVGGVLIVGAVVLLVTRKRMRED